MTATVAFILLVLALVIQGFSLFFKNQKPAIVSPWLLMAATVLLATSIIQRSMAISFIAITSIYESLLVLAGFTSMIVGVYGIKKGQSASKALLFGGTFIAFLFLVLTSSPLSNSTLRPPVPALQSAWLVLHVVCTFIGEAFFAFGFIAAILQLASKDAENRNKFDRLAYTSIAIGYPLFTAGALVFGAIWAEAAWGRWWSWDPKETWALITWLVYTAYLHLRLIRKSSSRLVPALVVLGFLLALFTFFGVNLLLPGLHSYG